MPNRPLALLDSDFLRYLIRRDCAAGTRLPPLEEISAEVGISVGKLREQLEVARMLGLVEVSPGRGIHFRGYDFLPAVRLSLMMALALDSRAFTAFSTLRCHLESAFWDEAVALLQPGDVAHLRDLVARAWEKLAVPRVQIPHPEHREFHLTIFSRLENPFVCGLLEAYWDAYEAVELNTYADYNYLQDVWSYHDRIAQALEAGELALGKRYLMEHMQLIDRMGTPHEDVRPVAHAARVAAPAPK